MTECENDCQPAPRVIREVEVIGGRVRVERVEAYGLEIDVDANDRATAVRFPDGAVIV